jgi:putative chitinase
MDAQTLRQIMPNNPDPERWAQAFTAAFDQYGITTPVQQAAFLAQCGHESNDCRAVVENLNYSADALSHLFGKYFPGQLEQQYHRKPEQIANRIYANRMGNGPESSGDGWRYRGRGPIQMTGKDNYAAFAAESGFDAVNHPELVEEPEAGAAAAGFWWKRNHANRYADDVVAVSRLVNLGNPGARAEPHGMDDRRARWNRARTTLGV